MRRRAITARMIATAIMSLAACTAKESPEALVRASIAAAVEAAEAGTTTPLRTLIATAYADEYGNDRERLEQLLRLYVLGHRPLHIYTRVAQVTVSNAERADAIVFAAMAGERIHDRADLPRLRASLYRFELGFVLHNGQWRLIRAAWRPAEFADFF